MYIISTGTINIPNAHAPVEPGTKRYTIKVKSFYYYIIYEIQKTKHFISIDIYYHFEFIYISMKYRMYTERVNLILY
jgi:hypothetical protein